jgi:hypothetical protein
MNSNKPVSLVFGLFLIFFGGAALLLNTGFSIFGIHLASWRLWPLFVLGLGLVLSIAPLLVRNRRGLGGLFIPGLPILTTGALLSVGSLFMAWQVWGFLWPLEIISVALGFVFFAIYSRNIWLLIPALYIGANGIVLQFCALTGWWASWAMLWTVEPFCVGLMMLLIAYKTRSIVVMTIGLIISAFSLLAAASMSTLVISGGYWQFASSLGAICFILAGAGLLLLGNKKPADSAPVQPSQPTESN